MATYPRYRRDQLIILQRLLKQAPALTIQAMSDCHERQLWSANDLKNKVAYLQQKQAIQTPDLGRVSSSTPAERGYQVPVREMGKYTAILEGRG